MQVSPMRRQVAGTADAITAIFDTLETDARTVLATPDIYRFRNVIVTGCGDSLFAARSVELAMIRHAALPISVRPALEVARYLPNALPRSEAENTLLVAISNSGEAARVVEAAQQMAAKGATVLALTGNPDSRLAQSASHVLTARVTGLPSAPGFAGYTTAQVALILLAIRMAEVRMKMTMDEAQALRARLKDTLALLASTTGGSPADLSAEVETLAKAGLIEVVAPNLGLAEFGAAKFLEATGRHALARDVEEWMHLNYFDGNPDEIATCLVVPPGSASQSRIDEVLGYMRKLGRQIVVIGGDGLPLAATEDENWAPLLASAPLAFLAADLATRDGAEYGRGAKGRWEDCADARTVQGSELLEVEE